jgi:aquaporin rerated protein, other eukaryote
MASSAPVGIGLSLFIAELLGVYYTGGSLNPARSFGPCVILHSFNGYHWIYWVGPILGSLLASGFYMFIKALEYETVNPEQDDSGEMRRVFDPEKGEETKISGRKDLHADPHAGILASRQSDEETLRTPTNRNPVREEGKDVTMPAAL